MERWT